MDRQHIREEKIIDYVLDQLPSKEHFKINTHLVTCFKCRSVRDYWEKHLNVKTTQTPSLYLQQKVFAKIALKKSKINMRWSYVAVSLCFVFLLSFSFFQSPKQVGNHEYLGQSAIKNHILFEFNSLDSIDKNLLNILPTHIVNDRIWLMNKNDLDNLYLSSLATSPFDEHSQISFLDHSRNEQLIFVIEDSICSYNLYNKQISCKQLKINPHFNQPLQINSKTLYFNQ